MYVCVHALRVVRLIQPYFLGKSCKILTASRLIETCLDGCMHLSECHIRSRWCHNVLFFLVREDDFKLAVAVYSVVFFSAAGLDLHDSIQIQWLWMPSGFNTIS